PFDGTYPGGHRRVRALGHARRALAGVSEPLALRQFAGRVGPQLRVARSEEGCGLHSVPRLWLRGARAHSRGALLARLADALAHPSRGLSVRPAGGVYTLLVLGHGCPLRGRARSLLGSGSARRHHLQLVDGPDRAAGRLHRGARGDERTACRVRTLLWPLAALAMKGSQLDVRKLLRL